VVQAVSSYGFRIVDDDTPTSTVPQFPFYEHVPVNNRSLEAPQWMTEGDKYMLAIDVHQAVPCEQFRNLIFESGETRFAAVEQKRYEERSAVPGPGNDVIVAAVLVVWSDTMITTLKGASKGDWQIAHSGVALGNLFKAIPAHSGLIVLLESEEVCAALNEDQDMERKKLDPAVCYLTSLERDAVGVEA
jgi:hypothetical protein